MNLLSLTFGIGLLLTTSLSIGDISLAQDTESNPPHIVVLKKLFGSEAPECVPMSDIISVGTIINLSNNQFQFVRGMYVAFPPSSYVIPPGDHAIIGQIDDIYFFAIVNNDETCARAIIPNKIKEMILNIDKDSKQKPII